MLTKQLLVIRDEDVITHHFISCVWSCATQVPSKIQFKMSGVTEEDDTFLLIFLINVEPLKDHYTKTLKPLINKPLKDHYTKTTNKQTTILKPLIKTTIVRDPQYLEKAGCHTARPDHQEACAALKS